MAISFELTDEQQQLKEVVRHFARTVIAPRAEAFNARAEFPTDIVLQMGEMGLFGLPFPEEYGGQGGDYMSLCLAIEELGRVDQSIGITLEAGVGLGAQPIYKFGTEAQRKELLPQLAEGRKLAGFGLTEPGGGSDAGGLRTTAVRDGDHWIINGSKQFITNVGTDISEFVTITAVTQQGSTGSTAQGAGRQVTNFIIPTGTPGYTIGNGYRKVGWHASDTRDLYFEDVRVPTANQLGEEGRGFANFLNILDEGRIAISALAVGMIQGCVDECVRYAREREAFGKPIGSYQAVAFKIADMEAMAQVARNAYLHACWLLQEGKPFKTQASIAKLMSTEYAVTAAREATQIFGGYGFTTEYLVGRFYQDAKILEIGEGTSEVQRMLIARSLGVG
ncbi:MAG TPA: acyl-CoA dehydrogenase family protein [Euzebya sp.]|nr:acyl-CoA dehydrogenase family protein [Euzebya sp.]